MDGSVNGRIKCTLANWTGLCFKIPRTSLDLCKDRKELKQTGVYFLFGRDDQTDKSVVYVGQASVRKNGEGILNRLCEHNKNPDKDYWTEAIAITTSNDSLGPTEISYLEHTFCKLAKEAKRYEVKNGNDPTIGNLSEEHLKDPDSADVFLFVKRETNKCVYKGRVHIKQEPYLAPRHDDPSRKVWIFPLQLESVDQEKNSEVFQEAEIAAYDMDLEELYKKVKGKADKKQPKEATKKYDSTTSYYERDPEITTYAKRRSGGFCDLCDEPAPFKDKDGHPYLEAHHIIWLSKGGADEIDNVVALCPNCHKKMHIVADANDVGMLQQKIKDYKKLGR